MVRCSRIEPPRTTRRHQVAAPRRRPPAEHDGRITAAPSAAPQRRALVPAGLEPEPSLLGAAIRDREVSNRLSLALLLMCRQQGIATAPLVQGLGLRALDPLNAGGWHAWTDVAAFLERLGRRVGGPTGLERFTARGLRQFRALRLLGRAVPDLTTLYAYSVDHLMFATYLHLGASATPEAGGLRLCFGVPADYEAPPEFWHVSRAYLQALPVALGLPAPEITMAHDQHQAAFLVAGARSGCGNRPTTTMAAALRKVVAASERLLDLPGVRHAIFDADTAIATAGVVVLGRLLGTRLAQQRGPDETRALLGRIWRHYFHSREVALELGPASSRVRAGHCRVPLAGVDDPPGAVVVEGRVAAIPLFQVLLPWIGAAAEACRAPGGATAPEVRAAAAARRWGLTPRLAAVLPGLLRGESNRAIAAALGRSLRAVEVQLAAIRRRAGVATRGALIASAFRE